MSETKIHEQIEHAKGELLKILNEITRLLNTVADTEALTTAKSALHKALQILVDAAEDVSTTVVAKKSAATTLGPNNEFVPHLDLISHLINTTGNPGVLSQVMTALETVEQTLIKATQSSSKQSTGVSREMPPIPEDAKIKIRPRSMEEVITGHTREECNSHAIGWGLVAISVPENPKFSYIVFKLPPEGKHYEYSVGKLGKLFDGLESTSTVDKCTIVRAAWVRGGYLNRIENRWGQDTAGHLQADDINVGKGKIELKK